MNEYQNELKASELIPLQPAFVTFEGNGYTFRDLVLIAMQKDGNYWFKTSELAPEDYGVCSEEVVKMITWCDSVKPRP